MCNLITVEEYGRGLKGLRLLIAAQGPITEAGRREAQDQAVKDLRVAFRLPAFQTPGAVASPPACREADLPPGGSAGRPSPAERTRLGEGRLLEHPLPGLGGPGSGSGGPPGAVVGSHGPGRHGRAT